MYDVGGFGGGLRCRFLVLEKFVSLKAGRYHLSTERRGGKFERGLLTMRPSDERPDGITVVAVVGEIWSGGIESVRE